MRYFNYICLLLLITAIAGCEQGSIDFEELFEEEVDATNMACVPTNEAISNNGIADQYGGDYETKTTIEDEIITHVVEWNCGTDCQGKEEFRLSYLPEQNCLGISDHTITTYTNDSQGTVSTETTNYTFNEFAFISVNEMINQFEIIGRNEGRLFAVNISK